MMIGMTCMTERRLALLKDCIQEYEKWCEVRNHLVCASVLLADFATQQVTKTYGKKFNFLKQHMTAHVVDDIRQTGSLSNKTTRINEAYQQEARAQYETTNFKNAEQQV